MYLKNLHYTIKYKPMIQPIQPINTQQVTNYMHLQPLVAAVISNADKLPKTSLPTEIPGTVQSNTHNIPSATIYNAHGIVTPHTPNSLIAYA